MINMNEHNVDIDKEKLLYIIGIDQSLTCTATSIILTNIDTFEILEEKMFFTTKVKKHIKSNKKSLQSNEKVSPILVSKETGFRAARNIRDTLKVAFKEIEDSGIPTYCAIEGYSMGSRAGQAFSLGELGGLIKDLAKDSGFFLRSYPPTTVKKFGCGKGSGSKLPMFQAFQKRVGTVHDQIMEYYNGKISSPIEDMIDAYFISRLMMLEVQLRYGHITLKELPLHYIEIFNTVGKNQKVNLLAREFE